MFAESLLESNAGHAPGRRWATLASLSLQCAVVATLMILPMLRSDSLGLQLPRPLAVPIFTKAPQLVTEHTATAGSSLGASQDIHPFEQPALIPDAIGDPGPDVSAPAEPCVSCLPGPLSHGSQSVFDMIGTAPPPAVVRPTPPQRLRLSDVDLGQLVHRVVPAYPEIAKRAGIEGDVVLTALIGRDGSIESVAISSGNPFLIRAAADAVRQWRYRPYRLNGEAVEVETQITVHFSMNR